MNECVIYEENHPVGRLCWQSDGLRWHFQARIRACAGVRYLFLLDGQGKALRLGVPEPAGDGMLFQRILTRQGLEGLMPDTVCRAELRQSDAPPESEPPQAPSPESALPEQTPPEQEMPPEQTLPGPLRLYDEDGQLYVGEPFVPDRPLQLHTMFQKMVMREIDGVLYGLVPLG